MAEPARPAEAGAGTTVLESAISSIADDVLRYRGYDIEQLAGAVPFQDVAWLLWTGTPPDAAARAALRTDLAAGARLAAALYETLSRLPEDAAPVSRLLVALPQLPLAEPALRATSAESFTRRAALLLGAGTVLAAAAAHPPAALATPATFGCFLLEQGESIAAVFLSLARLDAGPGPSRAEIDAFETVLTLYADHELNASTFAGRVAASTRADLVSCIVAALCTLSGPLHGGVDRYVRALLAAAIEEGAEAAVDRYLRAGQPLPGFGHSIYRRGDPRARRMRDLAEQLAPAGGQQALYAATRAVEDEAARRGVPAANVDLYTVVVYRALRLPDRLSPLVFALARLAGWCAHVQEQYERNRLIRPRAAYVGTGPRNWPRA